MILNICKDDFVYQSKDVKEALLPLLNEEMPDNQHGYEIGMLM